MSRKKIKRTAVLKCYRLTSACRELKARNFAGHEAHRRAQEVGFMHETESGHTECTDVHFAGYVIECQPCGLRLVSEGRLLIAENKDEAERFLAEHQQSGGHVRMVDRWTAQKHTSDLVSEAVDSLFE